MKRFLLILAAAAVFLSPAPIARAQSDLEIAATSNYVQLASGVDWSAFNRVYYFSPLSPSIGVCVFVVNNNPTSAHSFTVNVYQTGDPSVQGYTGHTGRWTADVVDGAPSSIAAGTTGSFFANSNAAAQIAIDFSGAATATGSPDTADVYLVQTSAGNCGSVSASTSYTFNGTITGYGTPADPCLDPFIAKSSVAINQVDVATTNTLVTGVSGKSIYVCSVFFAKNSNGSNGYSQLVYGTGSTCIGTIAATGEVWTVNSQTNQLSSGAGGTSIVIPSGDSLCIVSSAATGASSGVGGALSYVQQ